MPRQTEPGTERHETAKRVYQEWEALRKIERKHVRDILAARFDMTRGQIAGLIRDYRPHAEGTPQATPRPRKRRNSPSDEPPQPQAATFEENGLTASASATGTRITSVDDLIAACEVDLSYWEPVSGRVKSWEVGRKAEEKALVFDEGKISGEIVDSGDMARKTMISIELRFTRREIKPYEIALDSLIERYQDSTPRFKTVKAIKPTGHYAAFIGLVDTHFNRARPDRTHSLNVEEAEFKNTADMISARLKGIGLPYDEIIIPFGNDGLNVDNANGTTTRGTWQELAGHQAEAVVTYLDSYYYLISQLAELAPVRVIAVPGNHDRWTSYLLGKTVSAFYDRHPNVTVDDEHASRKYYQYGQVLLGLDHGDKIKPEKLALLMASESPQQWADTRFRIWKTAHLHKNRGLIEPLSEHNGVLIQTLPAWTTGDDWHKLMGYTGGHRSAEIELFHKEFGPAGKFNIFVDNHSERNGKP